MDEKELDELGKIAYDAYCGTRGWKSVKGEQLPPWESQAEDLRAGWEKAVEAVVEHLERY